MGSLSPITIDRFMEYLEKKNYKNIIFKTNTMDKLRGWLFRYMNPWKNTT